jgi:thiol-disulfide isomerase/thioredoxin
MMKLSFVGGLLFILLSSTSLFAEQASGEKGGDLLGSVSATEVLGHDVFLAGYKDTKISAEEMETFGAIVGDIKLQVLFGTWCHDSQREVPQIIRLAEEVANPNISLSLMAVSRDKSSPADAVARYQLKYTPTIIVFKSGKEVGRIIEKPEKNWASDIATMLEKN